MWGHDVVQIMVCVPFLFWKFVHQNICYHSPHNFTALPTSRRSIYFFNSKMLPNKEIKKFWAFWNFDLNWFTWLWGDDVVQIMVCVPFSIWKYVHQNICYHSPHNLTALPTFGRNIYFLNFKMLPSKDDEGILSIFYLWFNFIYMNVRWWCCADYGVCSIFDLKICTPKYLLPLPT